MEEWNQLQQEQDSAEETKGSGAMKAIMLAMVCLVGVLVVALTVVWFFVHISTEGSCTEEQVCRLCGKVLEEAAGHQWDPATCEEPKTCSVCGQTKGDALDHEWKAADCETPKTCTLCGATEGQAAGHSWTNASCTEKRTCAVCGKTDGEPRGHDWREATCEEPRTCASCGAAEGEPLGHQWMDATYTSPMTCALCGETVGEPLREESDEPTEETEPRDDERSDDETGVDPAEVDVEAQVLVIREQYNEIVAMRDSGSYRRVRLDSGVDLYYDDQGDLRCAVVYRGISGIGSDSDVYSRSYYYTDGELIFAFYEGEDAHRFYFYEGSLMRWRYTSGSNATNYDFAYFSSYLRWEQTVLEEARSYLDVG